MTKQSNKLWGGRFSEPTDEFVQEFTASVQFDNRLYYYDIVGSIAHATMLETIGVLSKSEAKQIIQGLKDIQFDIERGDFAWSIELEDVHMNIEARLTDRIGEVGKKLHTGRSRNDQVATDIRLYLRHELDTIDHYLERLLINLLDLAEREFSTIMPGFTHLQTAQPVTLGHHIMAWFEMIQRDRQRFVDCRKRVNHMPLGSAALAGTTYNIDRTQTAELLGFDDICKNSMDAVSDRDFAIEFVSNSALFLTHLSRISEELVLWSSVQFGFVNISDAYCTGSSIMPQKKNPDVPELVRGKTGRVNGNLVALLTLMKSQPLAYNKDNQEDKEPLFDTVDTVKDCLIAYNGMISGLEFNRDTMRNAAAQGYSTATDLADYLVRNGVTFRDAHDVVGRTVAFAIEANKDLSELDLEEIRQFSSVVKADVFEFLTVEGSVAARNHIGGTAPEQVKHAIIAARNTIKAGQPLP